MKTIMHPVRKLPQAFLQFVFFLLFGVLFAVLFTLKEENFTEIFTVQSYYNVFAFSRYKTSQIIKL